MSDIPIGGKLEIGRVVQQTFAVLGRNFATFGILALLLTGLPTALLYLVQGNALTTTTDFGTRFFWGLLGGLVAGVFGLILQGTIIYATVADLNQRRLSVAESLSAGLHNFLPILGIGLLFVLGYLVGIVLLIIPGIMVAIAWCVAVPSYVVERIGIIESFGRSAQLTRGNRWRIFGLFCLLFIALFIFQAIVLMLSGLTNFATVGGIPLVTRVLVLPLVNVGTGLLGSVGAAVLYAELRRLKDGVGAEGLAAIFD